jgi:hypothetical protein
MAFEFLGSRIAVLDDELDLLAGGDDDFGRLELVVLDDQPEFIVGRGDGWSDREAGDQGEGGGNAGKEWHGGIRQ